LARLLWSTERKLALRVARFDGGNLRNAIPREAWAVVAVPEAEADNFAAMFEKFHADVKAEYALTDEGLKMTLSAAEAAEVVSADTTRRMLCAVVGVPNGVLAMSASLQGLVETSTNLASVKFTDTDIIITTSQRSSVESAKYAAAQAVESVFELAGAKVAHSDGYPGWTPSLKSHILSVTSQTYKRLFDTEAKVRAIHAGLECGLFLEKYPELDMVSFGPTLRGVHSPDERLDIPSVDKFWKLLTEVLANI
jgi:dipeptidase D